MTCKNCVKYRNLSYVALRAAKAANDLDDHLDGCTVCQNNEDCAEFEALREREHELRHDATCPDSSHMQEHGRRFKLLDDLIEHGHTLAEVTQILFDPSKPDHKRALELAELIMRLHKELEP